MDFIKCKVSNFHSFSCIQVGYAIIIIDQNLNFAKNSGLNIFKRDKKFIDLTLHQHMRRVTPVTLPSSTRHKHFQFIE